VRTLQPKIPELTSGDAVRSNQEQDAAALDSVDCGVVAIKQDNDGSGDAQGGPLGMLWSSKMLQNG